MRHSAPTPFRPSPRHLLPWVVLPLALFATGCTTTRLPPISIQGAEFRPLPDEVELWAETRAEEQEILSGFPIVRDPVLGDYLQHLVERLAPSGLLDNPEIDLQVKVLADPAPLAFAFPHGTILVHTGLLDRTRNEDQLAAVLAREIVHVEGRHLARHQRAVWNKQATIATLSFAAAILLAVEEVDEAEEGDWYDAELAAEAADDVLFVGYELAQRVTADGYGRKLEREADEGAVRLLVERGYDPQEALRFYESLSAERADGYLPIYPEGSELSERIRSLRQKVATPGVRFVQPPLLDEAGFRLVVRPLDSPGPESR